MLVLYSTWNCKEPEENKANHCSRSLLKVGWTVIFYLGRFLAGPVPCSIP